MFHANGWCFPWAVTAVGGTHLCLRRVEPAEVYRLIKLHGVTHLCAAPTVLIPILFISGRVKRWEVEPKPAGASPNLSAALSVVCQPSVAAAGVLWPSFWPLETRTETPILPKPSFS